MKKYFLYLTLFFGASLIVMSCSKDDDEEEDPQVTKLRFVNLLTQNSTSCAWEGSEIDLRKELGSWSDKGTKYVVVRFDREKTTDVEGSGWLYVFEDAYYEHFKEKSEFRWSITNDLLQISYRHQGWEPLHAEYKTSELVIRDNKFDGWWFVDSGWKYEFHYKKSSFNNWEIQ